MGTIIRLTGFQDHARSQNVVHHTGEVVDNPSNRDRLVPKFSRWGLSHDRIASRTSGNHVAQRRDHEDNTHGKIGRSRTVESKSSNDNEAAEHEGTPAHVDCSPTDVRKHEPAHHAADDVASRERNIQVERLLLRPSCRLEEHDDKAEKRVAAENLCCPYHSILLGVNI